MMVASRAMATARPTPMALVMRMLVVANDPATMTMISAALVMMRPVRSRPKPTAWRLSWVVKPGLAHARQQEHLVVHGDAEQAAEHDHRQRGVDVALGDEVQHAGQMTLLEDEDEGAEVVMIDSELTSTALTAARRCAAAAAARRR